MNGQLNSRFRFAGFTLDLTAGRFFAGGEDVTLRPKSFALLSYLVRNAGRVVSKDELMTVLWPDVTVTEDSLTQCVRDVRRALGRDGKAILRTLARRGYMLAVEVMDIGDLAFPSRSVPAAPVALIAAGALGVGSGPPEPRSAMRSDGVAVLPFIITSSARPEDAHLLDGLVHDVISRLARLRSFHVIARGSTFALRHLAADPVAAGRALGVAYVVVGAATVIAEKVRLQVDLVDARTGRIVRTDDFIEDRVRYRDLLFSLTDHLVQSIQREITASERNRSLLVPDHSLDAWQAYHRGLFHMLQFTSDQSLRARSYFERSIQLDPGFARAFAGLSYCHFIEAFLRPVDQRGAEMDLAIRTAGRAMQLDEENPASRWAYGRALWLNGDEDGGISQLRTAVQLSPSFAMGHQTLAFMVSQSGSPEEAHSWTMSAEELSPFDPFLCAIYGSRAMALIRLGNAEEAAVWGTKAAQQSNVHKHILGVAALASALAGREADARSQMARILQLDAGYNLSQFLGAFSGLSEDATALVRIVGPQIGLT